MSIRAMRSRAVLVAVTAAVALFGWLAMAGGSDPSVAVVDAAQGQSQGQGIGRAVGEPPRGRPVMADESAVQASLEALERNGVMDRLMAQSEAAGLMVAEGAAAGRGLLPIFHVVECDEVACADVIAWAEANDMEPSEVLINFGHGGVEEHYVELGELVPPAAPQLARRAESVMEGVSGIDGAVYGEWMADNRANVRGGGQ